MVARFQSVISEEIKKQLYEHIGRENPDYVIACIGGGSNAAGAFYHFIDNPEVKRNLSYLCTEHLHAFYIRLLARYVRGSHVDYAVHNVELLKEAYYSAIDDPRFIGQFNLLLHDYVGRPSPLYKARKLSEYYRTNIYLKREDLNPTVLPMT